MGVTHDANSREMVRLNGSVNSNGMVITCSSERGMELVGLGATLKGGPVVVNEMRDGEIVQCKEIS